MSTTAEITYQVFSKHEVIAKHLPPTYATKEMIISTQIRTTTWWSSLKAIHRVRTAVSVWTARLPALSL